MKEPKSESEALPDDYPPRVDEFMDDADLTAAAERIWASIDWKKLPKLAPVFEHRPRVNRYWHELVAISLHSLKVNDAQALSKRDAPALDIAENPDDEEHFDPVEHTEQLLNGPAAVLMSPNLHRILKGLLAEFHHAVRFGWRCDNCGKLYLDHALYGGEPMKETETGEAIRCGEWITDEDWHTGELLRAPSDGEA